MGGPRLPGEASAQVVPDLLCREQSLSHASVVGELTWSVAVLVAAGTRSLYLLDRLEFSSGQKTRSCDFCAGWHLRAAAGFSTGRAEHGCDSHLEPKKHWRSQGVCRWNCTEGGDGVRPHRKGLLPS